ncbi:MAG: hypothetical protein HC906_07940 [Bacteroidales bacterium]|nr:hypothetical protein [Bacteroidales bacterium]
MQYYTIIFTTDTSVYESVSPNAGERYAISIGNDFSNSKTPDTVASNENIINIPKDSSTNADLNQVNIRFFDEMNNCWYYSTSNASVFGDTVILSDIRKIPLEVQLGKKTFCEGETAYLMPAFNISSPDIRFSSSDLQMDGMFGTVDLTNATPGNHIINYSSEACLKKKSGYHRNHSKTGL